MIDKEESTYIGPLRWRGKINFKDVTERVIAGIISGLAAGVAFWIMMQLLGTR